MIDLAQMTDGWSPVTQAWWGGVGTWGLTLLGTLPVLFVVTVHRRTMDGMMGVAAGIMVAASCWSLLVPALATGRLTAVAVGVIAGAAFLSLLDRLVPHVHAEFPDEAVPEGPRVSWRRPMLLMMAITMHNLPEGLAIGLGFGSGEVSRGVALAVGIGIQNIPEGLAIALPLRRDGMSRGRAFWYGQLSAVVEPVAAVAGAAFVTLGEAFLPFGLAFAAGAMLFVVVEELLPETTRAGNVDVAALGFMVGFVAMMLLDQIAV